MLGVAVPSHKQATHAAPPPPPHKQIILGPIQEFSLLPMVMFDKCLLARKHSLLKGRKKKKIQFCHLLRALHMLLEDKGPINSNFFIGLILVKANLCPCWAQPWEAGRADIKEKCRPVQETRTNQICLNDSPKTPHTFTSPCTGSVSAPEVLSWVHWCSSQRSVYFILFFYFLKRHGNVPTLIAKVGC